MTVYTIARLIKLFGTRTVLDIANLDIEDGSIYALLGPNGAGKTTLLNILAFLDSPTSGQIYYHGKPIRFTETQLQVLRKEVVMVDQHPILFSTTVFKNLEFGLKIRKIAKRERERIIEETLDLVDMRSFIRAQAHRLSGGETQRVALARGLALSPKVFLCDEPTSSVDAENQTTIMKLLRRINEDRKITVIFTTHDRSQAADIAHHLLLLDNGRLVPAAYENIFSGRLFRNGQRQYRCRIREDISLVLTQPPSDVRNESVRIFIDPELIVPIGMAEIQGGLNRMQGRVVQIMSENGKIRMVIDIGHRLTLLISRDDYENTRPLVGDNMGVYIPPDAVRVVG
jgi:tungstate transport system ATP-binding protein